MSTNNVTPNPDAPQPQAVPAQAPSGVGSAITGAGPQLPVQPTAQPAAQPTATQPNTTPTTPTTAAALTAQPNAAPTAQNPVDKHVGLYTQILRGLVPPTRYIDPQGNVQEVPQTKVSAGKTILASVLAGMFATPNVYRQGAYGPVLDNSATTANAFNAGQSVVAKQNTDAQALSDKQQAVKLSNIKNSIDQVHLMAALTQQRHQELQGVIDSNQPALDDFKAMDDKQADPSKKIILSEPMTLQQAMDSPLYGKGKMTTNSILMSHSQQVYDPETGETHEVPLFTILSPEAGGVTISEDQKKNFSTINRSFDGMGGLDARIPIHQYLALQGNLTSVQHFQSFIKRADEQLGIKEDADLAAAVKKDPTLINGIRAAEGALAQGGSTADTLQRIQHGTNGTVSWNSSALFEAMGLDQDKVAQYIKDQANKDAANKAAADDANKLAFKQKEEAIELDKDEKLAAYKKSIGLAADDNDSISPTKTYPNEWVDPKTKMHYNLNDSIYNMVEHNEDPSQLTKRSKNYDANLKKANDYSFARYGKTFDAAQATEDYKYANQKTTQDTIKMLQSLTGEDGKNTGGTLNQLSTDLTALGNTPVPKFNQIENWASQNAGRAEVTNTKATLFAVADEMAKILGGGNATVEGYRQAHEIIDDAFSHAQGQGAVTRIRAAMANRQNAMVGKNVYLDKQYGKMDNPLQPIPPKQGDTKSYQGANYTFDGKQWTRQ